PYAYCVRGVALPREAEDGAHEQLFGEPARALLQPALLRYAVAGDPLRKRRDVLGLVDQRASGVPVPGVGADVEVERLLAQRGRHGTVQDLRRVALIALAAREQIASPDEREGAVVEVVHDLAEQHVDAPVVVRGRIERERIAEV